MTNDEYCKEWWFEGETEHGCNLDKHYGTPHRCFCGEEWSEDKEDIEEHRHV